MKPLLREIIEVPLGIYPEYDSFCRDKKILRIILLAGGFKFKSIWKIKLIAKNIKSQDLFGPFSNF